MNITGRKVSLKRLRFGEMLSTKSNVWDTTGVFINSLRKKRKNILTYDLNNDESDSQIRNGLSPSPKSLASKNNDFWRGLSSGIKRRVVRWKSTDVSQDHVASIFRVEEEANQKTSYPVLSPIGSL
jgi:hypothetical protein